MRPKAGLASRFRPSTEALLRSRRCGRTTLVQTRVRGVVSARCGRQDLIRDRTCSAPTRVCNLFSWDLLSDCHSHTTLKRDFHRVILVLQVVTVEHIGFVPEDE